MRLELKDFFSFTPSAGRAGGSSSDPEVREAAKSGRGLKVTFAASHAGMVNGNKVMYSPRGMKDSCHTWVWPQRQPIQVHHDDHADPIGRVIGARYAGYDEADVSEGQSDALRLFSDGVKLTRDNVVEIARALEDSQVLGQADWRGVGELLLDGIVTDADAVEKILDGRYQGVSITQRPKQAFCSLCGQDWGSSKGPCDHERGETDEESDRTMYLIVGDTDYAEVSYVNTPADKHAMGVDTQPIEGVPAEQTQFDQKAYDSSILDRSMQTTLSFQLVDSLDEETEMAQKDKTNSDAPKEQDSQEPEGTEEVPTTDPEPEVDSETLPEEKDEDSEDSNVDEPSFDSSPEGAAVDSDPKVTIEEALKCLFEDRDNLTGFMCDALFEAMEELLTEEDSDAKLSTKKRKSLAGSTFCGPNRSFPVNDCAHYTAAKRLLGRYKGPGSKDSIMDCIEKKGKALGCSTAKDEQDSTDESGTSVATHLKDASDEVISETLLSVEKLMVDRGLKAERKCDNCESLAVELDEFKSGSIETQDTLRILRSEYQAVLSDHTASEDSHQETLVVLEDSLQSIALTNLLLTDKETSREDLETKVKGMTLEDLKKIVKETDLSEVISFVRSGLTQEPTETITEEDAEPLEEIPVDPVLNLSKSLSNFCRDHGADYAQKVMYDWIRVGKLPEGFTLDKAFELVAK